MALGASLISGFRRFRTAETAVAATLAVMITAAGNVPAEAAQQAPPKIDSFGPYRVGMPLADAKKADPNAKEGECGELAEDRRCLILKAAVFEEPAVIYAVLDEKRERVDKVIAKLDPTQSHRRAYRCIRLSEKVFALLVVVYGSKYKQQYDENRRPLPAVAWDGELEGRLIFRANCKSQDEGTPLISVVPRRGEGSSVAADLSPTATPNKGTESAADLLQGQKPGARQAARSDAVSSLAESAKRAEQQVRRTPPVAQAPAAPGAEPAKPNILGPGSGGLSIDDASIVPQPAPSQSQIDIDDPSMLPRAAPRTPVDVSLLPGSTPAPSKPAQDQAVPPKPAVSAQAPAAIARTPEPAAAPATAPPTKKAEEAPVSKPVAKIESAPAPTPPQAAAPLKKPVDLARLSPNVPLSRTSPAPAVPAVSGTAVDPEPEADQGIYVDVDDDEGEQSEPVREMPVFAQEGTATTPAPVAVQVNPGTAGATQAPVTTLPESAPTPVLPRDPAAQVASAAIPKSPKPAQPATGQPRSLIAARDTARPAADPTPRTYPAKKPETAAAVGQPVRPGAPAPVQEPAETTVDLPDLDDEPTGTVAVSADRAPGPVEPPAQVSAPAQAPAKTLTPAQTSAASALTPAPTATDAPKPLEQRVASGQPRRLTRSAGALPDRARIDTPPSTGSVTAVPLAPIRSNPAVRPAQPVPAGPVPKGTPALDRPAAPNPAQSARVSNRPAAAPATPQQTPQSAPVSRGTADGVEDFGYQLDLRVERQRTRWKAPVPPVRPWRTYGTSSMTEDAVQTSVADTAVLDEPDSVETVQTRTENVRPSAPSDEPTGTATLDEPLVSNVTEEADPAPTSTERASTASQRAAAKLRTAGAPVPPKRPWDTLSDAVVTTSVTPPPVPAARPQPAPEPQQDQQEKRDLAEQPDESLVDTRSSTTSAPDIENDSLGRGTDILDHL